MLRHKVYYINYCYYLSSRHYIIMGSMNGLLLIRLVIAEVLSICGILVRSLQLRANSFLHHHPDIKITFINNLNSKFLTQFFLLFHDSIAVGAFHLFIFCDTLKLSILKDKYYCYFLKA